MMVYATSEDQNRRRDDDPSEPIHWAIADDRGAQLHITLSADTAGKLLAAFREGVPTGTGEGRLVFGEEFDESEKHKVFLTLITNDQYEDEMNAGAGNAQG